MIAEIEMVEKLVRIPPISAMNEFHYLLEKYEQNSSKYNLRRLFHTKNYIEKSFNIQIPSSEWISKLYNQTLSELSYHSVTKRRLFAELEDNELDMTLQKLKI